MQKIKIVFRRDFNEFKHWKTFKFLIVLMILGAVGFDLGMLHAAAGIKDANTIWRSILGNVFVIYMMIPQIIGIPMFCTTSLTKEKTNGVIMSLLATELNPSDIWIGKGLAAFFPGYISAVVSAVILLPVFYRIVFIPMPVLLCGFVLNPLLIFLITLMTVQISMVRSVEMAIAPSYIIDFLLLFGIPLGSILGLYDISSVKFTIICAVLVAVFGLAELILSKKMTKEGVILAQIN